MKSHFKLLVSLQATTNKANKPNIIQYNVALKKTAQRKPVLVEDKIHAGKAITNPRKHF